jgi:hypothetical protein
MPGISEMRSKASFNNVGSPTNLNEIARPSLRLIMLSQVVQPHRTQQRFMITSHVRPDGVGSGIGSGPLLDVERPRKR